MAEEQLGTAVTWGGGGSCEVCAAEHGEPCAAVGWQGQQRRGASGLRACAVLEVSLRIAGSHGHERGREGALCP